MTETERNVTGQFSAEGRDSQLLIRHAVIADVPALTAVERQCFPPAEAATEEQIRARVQSYGDHFWLLQQGNRIISFVDGMVTEEPDLTDRMYEEADLHNPDGSWQMIFGVNTIPAKRRKGYAGRLLREAIRQARQESRRGLVLTCKEQLIPYYAGFGFVSEGLSASVHGNVTWYQMRLNFADQKE